MSGQGSGTNRQGRGKGRAVIGHPRPQSQPRRNRRMRRGWPAPGRPQSGRRSGRSGLSGGGPPSRSLPTLTSQRVATASASQRRAARAGTVIGVYGPCHPPRLGHVQLGAHQVRSPSHLASHPSGAKAVRLTQGASWPAPHQATSVHSRWQSRERHAGPPPRQRCSPGPTHARSQSQRAGPAGRHCAPWLIRRQGGHPKRTIRRHSPRAERPRAVRPSTVQSVWSAGRHRRSSRHHARRHAPGWCAGSSVQATGIAHPRETPQTASPTHRAPQAVASRAKASWGPVQRGMIQERKGTKPGVPSSA
jgi:hypothetical protein